jgi:hypothetical protein
VVFCASTDVAQTATLAESASAREHLMVISISFQKLLCDLLENLMNSVQNCLSFGPAKRMGFNSQLHELIGLKSWSEP